MTSVKARQLDDVPIPPEPGEVLARKLKCDSYQVLDICCCCLFCLFCFCFCFFLLI